MKTVTQSADVVGRIWQGCKAAYTYNLIGDAVPTLADVRATASDFAEVTDYRVRRVESTVEYLSDTETLFTTRHVLAKDWARKGSERLFEQCTGGEA